MNLIQIILILGLIISSIVYYTRFKPSTFVHHLFAIIPISGILVVLYPDITIFIANYLGVGRGADLIFYLGFNFVLFAGILFYLRYKQLKIKLTQLSREITLLKKEIQDLKESDKYRE